MLESQDKPRRLRARAGRALVPNGPGSARRQPGWRRGLVALGIALMTVLSFPALAGPAEEQVQSEIGTLRLIHPEGTPKGLLLYLAGERGWDSDTDATARALAEQAYLVAGIESATLSPPSAPDTCWNLGTALTRLADQLAGQAQIQAGSLPLLLGEAEGASLAYAALLQAPAHSFHAAFTLDFCPSRPLDASLCPGTDGSTPIQRDGQLQPAPRVESTWFALTTDRGSSCPGDSVDSFVAQVSNARLVSSGGVTVPNEGGGDWQRQLIALVQWLDPRIPNQLAIAVSTADIAGLPLTEVPAAQEDPTTFAVMLSGDGGWAALDRGLAAELAARGISAVGLDSLAYFWKARSPEEASGDLGRVIHHYLDAWHKARVVLIGYSMGADVLPFLVNRLPPALQGSVALVALLGPSPSASFEFHLSEWLSSTPTKDALPTLPELQRLDWTRRLCIYGEAEKGSVCPALVGTGVELREVPGDHHFDHDYQALANLILNALKGAGPADR